MIPIKIPLRLLCCLSILLASLYIVVSLPQELAEDSYESGRSNLFIGNLAGATGDFQKSIAREPDQAVFYSAHALALLGEIQQNLGINKLWLEPIELPENNKKLLVLAELDYKKAISLSPYDGQFWSNLGWVETFLRKDKAAADDWRHAVELDPNDIVSRISFGLLCERQGNLDLALREYSQAIAIAPKIIDSQFFVDLNARNRPEAQHIIQQSWEALQASPASPIVSASKAKLLSYQGNYPRAYSEYKAALGALPNLSYAWSNLGALELLTNSEDAETDFRKALFIDGGNLSAIRGLASLQLLEGNVEEAKWTFVRALFVVPVSVHAERTWRIYHVAPVNPDDIIPTGLLAYINPLNAPLKICGDWLDKLLNSPNLSKQVKDNIDKQAYFCEHL